jgi:putative protease
MEAAWEAGVRSIYCEFEDPKRYREAVARFRELQATASDGAIGSEIWVLPPRVSKPGEDWIHRIVASCESDGILARNYDHLVAFPGRRLRGDFSLNVANPWTVAWLRERYGLERLTASYDLNVTQLEALLESTDAAVLDITIHQHMPMFHMEHCVFCAFLSDGTDYRNCGRPCDHHDVRLRDRVGAEHPLKADAGCRNTVYNSRAQTGAEYVSRMIALGARHFRADFLNEAPTEVGRVLGRYAQLLRGEIRGSELWGEFKLINQLGVTRGQLDAPARVIVPKAGG